jgi:Dolichyl-phosphate-mannose-protein mannosyltransferase
MFDRAGRSGDRLCAAVDADSRRILAFADWVANVEIGPVRRRRDPLALGGANAGDVDAKLDVGQIGDDFWQANEDRVRFWFLLGRTMIIPLATLTGLVVVLWARSWYGERAALVSAVLWMSCPTILANAAIVTHDLPLAAAWILTLWTLVRFAEKPSWQRSLGFGAALGVAQLTKLTALVLGPLSILLWLVLRVSVRQSKEAKLLAAPDSIASKNSAVTPQSWKSSVKYWATALLTALLVLNAGYLFRGTGTSLGSLAFSSDRFQSVQQALLSVGGLPVPLPRDYVAAMDRLAQDLERQHPVYLDGEWSVRPFARYYAAALGYKLPLSTLGLILVSCAVFAWPRPGSQDRRRAAAVLIAAGILPVLASGSANQIGIRYVLPTLPLLIIFAGQAMRWADAIKSRVLTQRLIGLFVWAAVIAAPLSLTFHPHHLAYFNAIAGGPVGGRWHLVDSNIDWGQDLHALKAYLDEHHLNHIGLAYFGTVVPSRVGIASHQPPSRFPQPGWYAISVNFVQGRPHALRDSNGDRVLVGVNEFRYFCFFEPVARIGYSIDVYHLTDADVSRYAFALRQLQDSSR